MAEPVKYNLSGALFEDGTIDFYTLLGETSTADSEVLKAKIQGLYNEAQANRDHRNLNKRREYQTLLELLPHAKGVLLDDPKRARYDAYLKAAKSGTAEQDFETFMNDLMGFKEEMEEKTGLLGVQEKRDAPRVKTVQAQTKTVPLKTPAPTAPATSGGSGFSPMALVGALVGFLLGAGIVYAVAKDFIPAILAGIILAAIGFVVLNKSGKTRVGR